MDEHLDEELEIMSEQSASIRVELDMDVFEQAVGGLLRHPLVAIGPGEGIQRAIELMREERRGAVLVAENGLLLGIVTERDLLMKVGLEGEAWKGKTVRDLMTPDPDCLQPEDAVKFVMNHMHVGGYRHVPIIDDERRPLGVIAMRDLLAFLLDQFPKLVTNIPPRPSRGAPPWGG